MLRLHEQHTAIIDALIAWLEQRPDRPHTRRGPAKISSADAVRYALEVAARVLHLPCHLSDSQESEIG
jgi:hypothetical protein